MYFYNRAQLHQIQLKRFASYCRCAICCFSDLTDIHVVRLVIVAVLDQALIDQLSQFTMLGSKHKTSLYIIMVNRSLLKKVTRWPNLYLLALCAYTCLHMPFCIVWAQTDWMSEPPFIFLVSCGLDYVKWHFFSTLLLSVLTYTSVCPSCR